MFFFQSMKNRYALLAVAALIVFGLAALCFTLPLPVASSKSRAAVTQVERTNKGESFSGTSAAESHGPADSHSQAPTQASSIPAVPANQGSSGAASSSPTVGQNRVSTLIADTAFDASSRRGSTDASASATSTAFDSSSTDSAPKSRSVADILEGVDLSVPGMQEQIAKQLLEVSEAERQEVLARAAREGIPVRVEKPDGGVMELARFDGDTPVYRETFNVNAAISSGATQLYPAPYSLDGSNVTAGVWDAGAVRSTHQEFTAGGASRVSIKNSVPIDAHATHVAGTVIAGGAAPAAKGMAPKARVDSYDWNSDFAEMFSVGAATASASGKLPISNHSYGIGLSFVQAQPWIRGAYHLWARDADAVARSLPYYLPFFAAGNAQDDFTDLGGYETIWGSAASKNVMTVGAVNDAVSDTTREPANGTMSFFSSWGPCDDGRIKPDIVANGVGVYSSVQTSDTAYASYNGTSMATPSATGSAALLVQYYRDQLGGFMRASTLKALLIHTADDLGNPGPDYRYGWGLMNVKAAADLIEEHKASLDKPKIIESAISGVAQTHKFNWSSDNGPIRVTLCWTDPAGAEQTSSQIDNRTPRLVHDLDVTVTAPNGTSVTRPFAMPFVDSWTTASMSAHAVLGRNKVDTVEQVLIPSPGTTGEYTVTVSVTGSLTSASQSYSLIISGGTAGSGGGGAGTKIISLEGDLSFGQVTVNETAQRVLRVRNAGTQTLRVNSLSASSSFAASPAGPFDVPAGGEQTVNVSFTPTAATTYTGNITANSDATAGAGSIAVSGSGIQAGTVQVLQNNVAVSNLAGATTGHEQYFRLAVPAGQQTLKFAISGGTGDADIYVRRGAIPTTQVFDFRPYIGGNTETVDIPAPAAGDWFVMIRAYAPYNGLTLLASYSGGAAGTKIVRLEGNLDFGYMTKGGSVVRDLMVHNDGNTSLSVSKVEHATASSAAAFSYEPSGAFTVAPGQSETVKVTFNPTEAKIYSGSLRVTCDKTSGTDTIGLAAIGVESAAALQNDVPTAPLNGWAGSSYLFSLDVPANQTALTITTTGQSGDVRLYVKRNGIPGVGVGESDFSSVGPGVNKTINVTAPIAAKYFIMVASDSSASFQQVVLKASYGSTASRIIRITGSLAFGSTRVGETASRTMQVVNEGVAPLTVTGINAPAGFAVSPPSIVVQPGASQNVTVSFKPLAAQVYGGNIEVVSDKTSGAATLACSGTGTPADDAQLLSNGVPLSNLSGPFGAETHYRFSVPSDASNLTIRIYGGSGDADLYVRRAAKPTLTLFDYRPYLNGNEETVNVANPAAGDWYIMLQGYSLYSGVTLVVTYSTGSIGGTRIISLSGDMSFGAAPVFIPPGTIAKQLTIANAGNSALTVSSLVYPAGFSGDWSGGIIAAGASQVVNVTFFPTEAKPYGGMIIAESNSTSGSGSIACSGTGVPLVNRVIELSGDLNFGLVNAGSSAQRVLTIYNTGSWPLLVGGINYPTGFFGDWFGGTIAAGESQVVNVTFFPTEARSYTGSLVVNSDATSGMNTVFCSGSGVSADGVVVLQTDVQTSVTDGMPGEQRFFVLNVPPGVNRLSVSISGGTGDGDLYVKYGAVPSLTVWDYCPFLGGNEESVTVDNPPSGPWFFMVNGYDNFSGLQIFVSHTGSAAPPGVPPALDDVTGIQIRPSKRSIVAGKVTKMAIVVTSKSKQALVVPVKLVSSDPTALTVPEEVLVNIRPAKGNAAGRPRKTRRVFTVFTGAEAGGPVTVTASVGSGSPQASAILSIRQKAGSNKAAVSQDTRNRN